MHDADYEKWPEEHPNRIVGRLRELGEERIAHAISAHYTKWNVPYDTLLSKALIAADELTGFTVACCLVRPEGVMTLQPKSVKKRFKQRAFAAKVEREEIEKALQIYGVEFADQVTTKKRFATSSSSTRTESSTVTTWSSPLRKAATLRRKSTPLCGELKLSTEKISSTTQVRERWK